MAEVARVYQVSPNRLQTWRGKWGAQGELAFSGHADVPKRIEAEG
jgi:transposase-like protein